MINNPNGNILRCPKKNCKEWRYPKDLLQPGPGPAAQAAPVAPLQPTAKCNSIFTKYGIILKAEEEGVKIEEVTEPNDKVEMKTEGSLRSGAEGSAPQKAPTPALPPLQVLGDAAAATPQVDNEALRAQLEKTIELYKAIPAGTGALEVNRLAAIQQLQNEMDLVPKKPPPQKDQASLIQEARHDLAYLHQQQAIRIGLQAKAEKEAAIRMSAEESKILEAQAAIKTIQEGREKLRKAAEEERLAFKEAIAKVGTHIPQDEGDLTKAAQRAAQGPAVVLCSDATTLQMQTTEAVLKQVAETLRMSPEQIASIRQDVIQSMVDAQTFGPATTLGTPPALQPGGGAILAGGLEAEDGLVQRGSKLRCTGPGSVVTAGADGGDKDTDNTTSDMDVHQDK